MTTQLIVLEKDGKLSVLFKRNRTRSAREISNDKFQFESDSSRAGDSVVFSRDSRGKVTQVEVGNRYINAATWTGRRFESTSR
jgi:hypothetical protein